MRLYTGYIVGWKTFLLYVLRKCPRLRNRRLKVHHVGQSFKLAIMNCSHDWKIDFSLTLVTYHHVI